MKNKTMYKLAALIILFQILLFTAIPLIIDSSAPPARSYDSISMLIRTQQISVENSIPWDTDNMIIDSYEKSIGRTAKLSYPPGLQIFFSVIKQTIGLDIQLTVLTNAVFWIIYSLFIFAAALKITKNKIIGLFALFFSSTIISGGVMLGPNYALPTTLGTILIFAVLFVNTSSINIWKKFIFSSIFLTILFISHRASIFAWLLILGVIGIFFLIFNKNRLNVITNNIVPLFAETALSLSVSYFLIYRIFLINEFVTRNTFLGQDFTFLNLSESTLNLFGVGAGILIAVSIISVIIATKMKTKELVFKQLNVNIKKRWFIGAYLLFFTIIAGLIATSFIKFVRIEGLGTILSNPLSSIYSFWNVRIGAEDIIRNYVYFIHWGIIPFLLIPFTLVLMIKNIINNKTAQLMLSSFIIIVLGERLSGLIGTNLSSRLYFYTSPMIYIGVAIGTFYLYKTLSKRYKTIMKYSLIVLIVFSSVFLAQHILIEKPAIPNTILKSTNWIETFRESDEKVFGQRLPVMVGRLESSSDKYVLDYNAILKTAGIDRTKRELIKHDVNYFELFENSKYPYQATLSKNEFRSDIQFEEIYDNGDITVFRTK